MEDSRYLETIDGLCDTVKTLVVEKNKKINDYKMLIIAFIIAMALITAMFAGCITYGIYSIYGYDYTVTSENINTNTNKNGGVN